jgi:hypothetical protein
MLSGLKNRSRKMLMESVIWDSFVLNSLQRARYGRQLRQWEQAGKPIPPPSAAKRSVLAAYAAAFAPATFIETGTFLGQTVHAMKDHFQSIYSIELNKDFANRAKRRFQSYSHIQILEGDSGEVLPTLLQSVKAPCLFWLDGHYSGSITAQGTLETPVMAEVRVILDHPVKNHVILIDDARCFDGTHDYPTLLELEDLVKTRQPSYEFSVANDVIRIHPRKQVPSPY